jgi:hypothetical protein
MSVHKACVIHDAVTDAEGRCSLSGPAGVALGLCVRGPGHVPLRRSDVRLDVASELVITVATGGTLRGKVVPAEAVAELVRLERAAADGGFPGHGARVRLRQGRTTHPLSSARDDDPAEVEARVRPDGTFAMTGVPPGDWVVEIVTFGVNPVPVTRGRSGSTTAHAGARVHVSDSEVANVDVDLLAIVPGALAGTVMRRGQPVANAPFVLVSGKHDGRVTEDGEWINLRTDAAGRFEYFGPADTFGLLLAAEREGTKEPFYVRAAERATTQRGATTAQTFAIASGTLELTVRDAAGRAVPGVQIASTLPETWFPVSDAAGRVVVEATAGPLSLRTLPKSLQSDAARSRYEQELQAGQRREPLATQCLDLGSVIVLADQTTKHEVHLPADWEK